MANKNYNQNSHNHENHTHQNSTQKSSLKPGPTLNLRSAISVGRFMERILTIFQDPPSSSFCEYL